MAESTYATFRVEISKDNISYHPDGQSSFHSQTMPENDDFDKVAKDVNTIDGPAEEPQVVSHRFKSLLVAKNLLKRGLKLGKALLPDSASPALLAAAFGAGAQTPGRIRIEFAVSPDLLSFPPVEVACWPNQVQVGKARHVALTRGVSVVRVPWGQPTFHLDPLGLEELPLRVLIVVACPDAGPIERDICFKEAQQLKRQLHLPRLVKVEIIRGDTLAELRRVCPASPPHVVHLIMHGAIDPIDGRGGIKFEGSDGQEMVQTGENLRDLLEEWKDHLRLVTLVSCRSAKTGENGEPSVAEFLLDVAPCVVAMQYVISSDEAAPVFYNSFYKDLLTRGFDDAVAAGRLLISNSKRDTLEWLTPVVWTKVRGSLFGLDLSAQRLLQHAEGLLARGKWSQARRVVSWFNGHNPRFDKSKEKFVRLGRLARHCEEFAQAYEDARCAATKSDEEWSIVTARLVEQAKQFPLEALGRCGWAKSGPARDLFNHVQAIQLVTLRAARSAPPPSPQPPAPPSSDGGPAEGSGSPAGQDEAQKPSSAALPSTPTDPQPPAPSSSDGGPAEVPESPARQDEARKPSSTAHSPTLGALARGSVLDSIHGLVRSHSQESAPTFPKPDGIGRIQAEWLNPKRDLLSGAVGIEVSESEEERTYLATQYALGQVTTRSLMLAEDTRLQNQTIGNFANQGTMKTPGSLRVITKLDQTPGNFANQGTKVPSLRSLPSRNYLLSAIVLTLGKFAYWIHTFLSVAAWMTTILSILSSLAENHAFSAAVLLTSGWLNPLRRTLSRWLNSGAALSSLTAAEAERVPVLHNLLQVAPGPLPVVLADVDSGRPGRDTETTAGLVEPDSRTILLRLRERAVRHLAIVGGSSTGQACEIAESPGKICGLRDVSLEETQTGDPPIRGLRLSPVATGDQLEALWRELLTEFAAGPNWEEVGEDAAAGAERNPIPATRLVSIDGVLGNEGAKSG